MIARVLRVLGVACFRYDGCHDVTNSAEQSYQTNDDDADGAGAEKVNGKNIFFKPRGSCSLPK